MAETHLERERKFDVPEAFVLPVLHGARRETHRLRATYYDTDDALLQSQGVTLRRRVGGPDDAWHLKVPHAEGKLEVHADVGPTSPPRQLQSLTRGLRFDRPLHPRAVLRTTREAHVLHAADDQVVAEIADDRVEATVRPADIVRWHEVEVELGAAGDADTMDQLAGLLAAAGATSSRHSSKYAHAVGEPAVRPGRGGVAGLADDYLQPQYDKLAIGDFQLRSGENVVHRTRVAVRRIRSTLRTFAPLFDEDRTSALDTELSWYADALGQVRDLDIARRHIDRDLADDRSGLFSGRGAAGLLHILGLRRQRAWEQLLTVLDGPRYGALLRQVGEWRREAPWTTEAHAEAGDVAAYVDRAVKKTEKRLAHTTTRDAPDSAFHRARKAAKRSRYAAELATPELGKRAKKTAQAHEQLQDQLGELQDHVMLVGRLREIADARRATAGVGFVAGLLAQQHRYGKEQARAAIESKG